MKFNASVQGIKVVNEATEKTMYYIKIKTHGKTLLINTGEKSYNIAKEMEHEVATEEFQCETVIRGTSGGEIEEFNIPEPIKATLNEKKQK